MTRHIVELILTDSCTVAASPLAILLQPAGEALGLNYTFFYLHDDSKVPSFDLIDCDGEAAARAKVSQILTERQSCEAVEVWDERGQVFVERRQSSPVSRPIATRVSATFGVETA